MCTKIGIAVLMASLIFVTVTEAYDHCNQVLNIIAGRIVRITPPNYPDMDSPGTQCNWTVESAKDKGIVFSCPFPNYKPLEEIQEENEELPCDGEFFITPESEHKTRLCYGQAFTQIVDGNRIDITYKVGENASLESFACYAFLKSNLYEHASPATYNGCDHVIHVEYGKTSELKSFNYPNVHPAGRNCRWVAISPPGSRIKLSCPYNEFALTERDPCSRILVYKAGVVDYTFSGFDCRLDENIEESIDNQMLIMFTSNEREVGAFHCNLTALCDQTIRVDVQHHFQVKIKSPNYPNLIPSGMHCRWTVESTMDSIISISHDGTDAESSPCHGSFNIFPNAYKSLIYNSALTFCADASFAEYSESNLTIFEFNLDENAVPHDPFTVTLSAVNKLRKLQEHKFLGCDHTITIEPRELKRVESPNFPNPEKPGTECRWTVIAPESYDIVFDGEFNPKPHAPSEDENPADLPCGFLSIQSKGKKQEQFCTQDKPFLQTVHSNNMTVTFVVTGSKLSDSFDFSLYTQPKPDDGPFKNCDHVLHLEPGDVREVPSPSYPKVEEPGARCRWEILAPQGYGIVFACNFTHNPPEPLHFPCSGRFKIEPEGKNKEPFCTDKSFLQTVVTNKMVITFEVTRHVHSFVCYSHIEEKGQTNSSVIQNEYNGCDHVIHLNYTTTTEIQSYHYPEENPPHQQCRWVIDSPQDTQIRLTCPQFYGSDPGEDPCKFLHIYKSGFEDDSFAPFQCAGQENIKTSNENKMLITFSNKETFHPHFSCNLTAICEHHIRLDFNNDRKNILSPNFPRKIPPGQMCRWTVESPENTVILFACSDPKHPKETPCRGWFEISGPVNESNSTGLFCEDERFTQVSVKNAMIIEYITKKDRKRRRPFECYVSSRGKDETDHE